MRLGSRAGGRRVAILCLTAAAAVGALGLTAGPARADLRDWGYFQPNGNCLAGTWTVPHGVTEIDVQAIGQAGSVGDGYDVADPISGDLIGHNDGGAGGHGSEVDTRIPVTPGETLYIGVANTSGPNAVPGGAGAPAGLGTAGGDGGAASWIANVAPIETQNGGCNLGGGPSNWLVVAAGGGGGGGAASRFFSNGGDGGTEAFGGGGSEGNSFPNSGGGGGHSNVTISNGVVVGSPGGGGSNGHTYNCTSGADGGAGDLLGDPQHFDSPPASSGGQAGAFDELSSYTNIGIGLIGIPDCSQPPSNLGALPVLPSVGGGGGGGGGGLYSGGGGGGSDDSGEAGGGGGASGTSYAKSPVSYSEGWTYDYPEVDIEAVTTAPSVTSADRATFVVGVPDSFTATATGVDTPYVDFRDDSGALENNGLGLTSATFTDGAGAGSATLAGTPMRSGVFNTTVEACTGVACADQGFQLTVDQAPGFASSSNALFAQGQQNTFTVRTSGFPAPAISASNAPSWLTVTDNGDGTATLSGTPPAGSGPNTYTVNLTASNTIGANPQPASAQQTVTFTIVKSLAISPTSTHLAPGFSSGELQANIFLYQYEQGWQQQFTVTGTRPDGTTFDATGLALWSSSNTAALTVSSGGLANATPTAGTSTVTAGTYGTLAASANVVVAVPKSITVTPGDTTLIPQQQVQFTATGCYGNPCSSNSYDITSHVGWSSVSNFVTVDADGLGTAGAYGTDTIFAELYTGAAPGEVVGFTNPKVTHGNATSISITPSQTKVVQDGTASYTALVYFQDGTSDPSNPGVRWSTQDVSGTNVASVVDGYGGTGQFYGYHAGTSTITASYTNPGGGTVSASATLTVIDVPTSLTVSGCSDPIVKATTCQLTATANYADGSSVDVTNGVTWSSDPSVFSVSSGGLLTATGTQEGATANVSASLSYVGLNGPETIGSNHLFPTVTLQHPVSLAIAPTSVPTLHPGGQQQFTATATYADGSTEDVTNQPWLHWFYDNSIASGVGGGLLQISNALQQIQGTVHVYAWDPADGVHPEVDSNTVPVTVTDPLDHVVIDPDQTYSPTIIAGQPVEGLHVEGYDSRGFDLGDVTADSTFSVSPDGACSGVPVICSVTTAGNHTITATDPNAATPLSGNSLTLQVTRAPAARIVVTGGSSSVFAGLDTAAYHVTAYDQYGNASDVTNQSTFCIFKTDNPLGCTGPPEHVNVSGRDFFSGCDYPSSTPTCHALVAGAHTVEVDYDGLEKDLPLYVDPSLVLTQLTLGGGPTGDVAVGAATTAYTTNVTDFFGNAGTGQNVALSITPDGTCDNQTETCTATHTGLHTVKAEGTASDGSVLSSNSLTFDAVDPDHLAVNGDSTVGFGRTTDPYTIEAYTSGGADLGDVTGDTTLSISPDGSCDDTAHTCTPTSGDSNGSSHTVTATYTDPSDSATATGSTSLTVTGVESIALIGDTTPIRAGEDTHAFRVEGYSGPDQTGADLGDVTAETTLSISPDGSCDNTAHTCTTTVADTNGSTHTITATFDGGSNPTSTLQIEVDPSPVVASAEIVGGSGSIAAGDSTAAYEVDGLDRYGNDIGNLTVFSTLSISPNQPGSSCDPVAHTCTAIDAGTSTVTANLGGGIIATTSLTVAPAAVASLDVSGGSDSVEVGDATAPYTVEAVDAYGNDIGDVTASATLSISPDGTCNDAVHTCTGTQPDLYVRANLNSRHTITASYGGATGTATVFVTPNLPPFATNAPYLDDMAQQYNQSGDFTLDWGATQDPEGDPLTYAVEQKSTAAGSNWQTVDVGLTCTGSCQYTFGGANPAAPEGAWTYRIVASDGYSDVPGSASSPVYVDSTAPTTTDDVPSSGWVTAAPFDATLTASDGATGSGVYETYFLVGNAGDSPPDPATTPYIPYDPPFNVPQLNDGQVVFYYSVDNAGNQEPVQTSAPASVDINPPTTTDDVPTTWVNQDPTVHLDALDDQTNHQSGVAATYYTVGPPPTITDPTTSSLRYDPTDPPVLTNGEEIKYFSVDNAGNQEQIETSAVAQVDTIPPTTMVHDLPTQPWTTPVTVTLAADDGSGSGVAETYYLTGTNLDPSTFWSNLGALMPYTGPVTLQPGDSIEYASIDNAGNQEQVHLAPTPQSQTVSFTTSAPANAVVGDTYTPAATASSGLPVSISPLAPPGAACVYVPGTGVKMIATGTCTVSAMQAGDNFYEQAEQTQTFTVGPKTLTVTGITAANKVYDGTTSATIDTAGAVLNGVVGHDVVTLDTASATGAFTDPSPGAGKTVQISGLTLSGARASNYVLAQPTTTADITAADATAPLDLQAGRGVRSLTVTWSPPASSGGDAVESYVVTATHGTTRIAKTLAAGTVCKTSSCSYTLTGLANATAYAIELSAETAAGEGASASASGTTDGAPGAPRSFKSAAGNGRASLEWKAPASDGGAPVLRYVLRVLAGKKVKETRDFSARACKGERCSGALTGLRNGTRYVLRLTAINAVGAGAAASANVTPKAKPRR